MSNWQDRFLGLTQLPADLSEIELEGFFRLSEKDLTAIKEAFRTKYWVAVGLQVGFFRFSGTRLSKFHVVPRSLLKFLGEQFGQPAPTIASLQTLYQNKNSRKNHQGWAMAWVGLRSATPRQEQKLFNVVREASKNISSIDRLIEVAQQWLFAKSLLIPAYSTLRDVCVRAASETEASIYEAICKTTSADQRREWKAALLSPGKAGRTTLEWLQQAPKRRSQKNLADLFDKIEYLNQMGISQLELAGVPAERLAAYARDFQHRKPSRVNILREVNLALQMVSFLKVTLSDLTDTVVQLFDKKTSDLVSQATRRVQDKDSVQVVSYRSVLRDIFALVDDATMDAEVFRERIRDISRSAGVTVFPSRASAVRAELTEKIPAVRSLLRKVTELEIKGTDSERAAKNLQVLKGLYQSERTELPAGEYDCPKVWHPLIHEEKDRQRAMRAFEMATAMDLRKGFRRGSCWIEYSATYRDREKLLIPAQAWERERRRHYDLLRLPTRANDYLEPLIKAAEQGLKVVAKALANGEFKIKADDVSLPELTAEPELPEVAEAQRLLAKEIGDIQFPEMLLKTDVATRFGRQLLGRPPASPQECRLTYAALLAHGTEMQARGIALMIPGLKEPDIAEAMKAMEYDHAIDRANKVVLQFIEQLPISAMLGDGKSASSDMMSVTTSWHLWNTRIDPRRQTPSIGMYSHVLDRYPIIYHQPMVLGERQGGVAIEGVIRQEDYDIERLAVDTHGYTDAAMTFAHMRGFDLCPRLKNLRERRLCIPRGMDVPEAIRSIVDSDLNLDFVREYWDDLVRVVASMSTGTMSAVTTLQRFGSAAQGDPIYRAAKHLGRLLRTIYLCDYFTKPAFRREIHRILNRGEHVHTLQHAIYFGAIPHDRARRRDELVTISAALALLTNITIAWTAYEMQGAMVRLEARGIKFSPDVWRHISPARYGRINFKGILDFQMERYVSKLLVDATDVRNIKPGERKTLT